jgi:glucose-6-phosphate isomerase
MNNIKFNYKHVLPFIKEEEIMAMEDIALKSRDQVLTKSGLGHEYLGWVDYAQKISDDELERIISASQEIKQNNDVLLVIGIGGSYLGAKAAIDMLNPYFEKSSLEIIFAGNTFSSSYNHQLLKYLETKDFAINVISKSGTTTEPALAFRLFKALLEKKYGSKAYKRIYATTDPKSGMLRQMAMKEAYTTFSIPEDIGGRYSVMTAVGLLPMACSGIDIKAFIQGMIDSANHFQTSSFKDNEAMLYAAIRNLLYRQGKAVELFVTYEPKNHFFLEWIKQLFGESEGKDGKGLFPASVLYSTDLHSLGQFIQDGSKILFETTIRYTQPDFDLTVPNDPLDKDGLNYLAGKSLDDINAKAFKGVILAHEAGQVPNLIIEMTQNDAYNLGYLVYFFLFSCAISGYMLEVNPFNQEGVEAYKKNMFALLGKKGYEILKKQLEERK